MIIPNQQKLYGGGSGHRFSEDIAGDMITDAIDTSLYRRVPVSHETKKKDKLYSNINSLWSDVMNGRSYIDQKIRVRNIILTEWLPMSPGRFHTINAYEYRQQAKLFTTKAGSSISDNMFHHYFRSMISNMPGDDGTSRLYDELRYQESLKKEKFLEFNPYGKEKMILGGIGNLRLTPKLLFNNQRLFIMGASSGLCHEGIPVLLTEELYSSIIDDLKDGCGLRCDLIGKLCILPTNESPIKYDRKITKYCLRVEDIQKQKPTNPNEVTVTVAISFADREDYYKKKKWSFVTFHPDQKENHLSDAVDWLSDYVQRYSYGSKPFIFADFDEFCNHFDQVKFPLKELAAGRIDFELLREYSELFNLKIVMGDNFENVSGTIINRSIITNSFNKVKEQLDSESADLLNAVNEQVQKSGNTEAVENMQSFHEEILKPEPKKSLLKSFWNGVTLAVPALISNSDKMVDLIEKITKMVGH